MKKILGISAFYHDSAAVLTVGDEIIAAAQEERFTREKHTADFPTEAIKHCLKEGGISINELDAVVFYDKPLLKFERLLETYYAFAPKGIFSFVKAMPVWLKEKLFLKKQLYDGLKEVEEYDKKQLKLLFSEHHYSHAASAFFPSNFKEAAILTIDGVGEWATASIGKGNENRIEILKEMHFPHSVGLLYSAFTYFLGFKVNSGEYKLMGLAPYGISKSSEVESFKQIIKTKLVKTNSDGSIWMNQKYFNYASGLRMVHNSKWKKLFGFGKRKESEEINQSHCNLAIAIQEITEEIVVKLAKEAKRITGLEYLCMAGGVALNCVANSKIIEEGIFKEVYIQPASGDAGGALGAALFTSHHYFECQRSLVEDSDKMKGSYLGPKFDDADISEMISTFSAEAVKVETLSALCSLVAESISNAKIVGWFQGRMEFGPRALGNRSILADPSHPEMQKKLNLNIKYREGFRPFAPSVLEEDANLFFEMKQDSPYMLLTSQVSKDVLNSIPSNYTDLPMKERLYFNRSKLQAITHLDFSARVQTVSKKTNPEFWKLLTALKLKNGKAVSINTSFNVRGEPIVNTPEDAYRCFMSTEMDVLVLNNFIFTKENQPNWDNKTFWKREFKKD